MSKPQPLSQIGKEFLQSLGAGFYRGLTLRIYKAKIKDIVGTTDFAKHIKGQRLTEENNPTLIIYMNHDLWRTELHNRRYQIKMLINKRLEADFLNKVQITTSTPTG